MTEYRILSVGLDGLILPLVERFATEGSLPNFSRVMREGASSEALPSLPAYTPTNWATLVTGARAGTHGLTGWEVRSLEQPFAEQGFTSFDRRACPTDTLWESAERQGRRSLSIYHPISWPACVEESYVAAPLYSGPGVVPLALSPGAEYSSTVQTSRRAHWTPFSECFQDPLHLAPVSPGEGEARTLEGLIGLHPTAGREDQALKDELLIRVVDRGNGFEQVLIYEESHAGDYASPWVELRPGSWSEWKVRSWSGGEAGSVRFKVLELDPREGNVRLVRSQIYPTSGFTHPAELAAELISNVGPFIEHPGIEVGLDPLANEAYFEEHRYQGLWMSRAAQYVHEKHGIDLYTQHYHLIDHVAHAHLARSDPDWRFYDENTGGQHLDVVRHAYQVADDILGSFLDQADERTVVAIVSDHGNVPNQWETNVGYRLAETGLFDFSGPLDDLQKRASVDWAATDAYVLPMRLLEVFVNLAGREPEGIVPTSKYNEAQDRIIESLLSWRDPETDERVIAFALKKQDADLVGLGGSTIGDVVFCYNTGFGRVEEPHGAAMRGGPDSWVTTDSRETTEPSRGGTANHGPQLPTARTEMHSNLATLMLWGTPIRAGYKRDVGRLGLPRLEDYAPTLSHLMGIRPPHQSQGSILYDFLVDEG